MSHCHCCDHCDEHNHCGEEHEEESKIKVILLIIGTVLFITAFILNFFNIPEYIIAIISIISVVLSGYDVFIDGIKAILKLRLDETTLMSIAAIAAIVLGEFVEAAAVVTLFGIGEYLEDIAVDKSRDSIKSLADIRPDTANLINENNIVIKKLAKDIEVGSILLINPHDRIPLDGTIIEGSSFIDSSALTGESKPIDGIVGTKVLSGMLNGDNQIKIKTDTNYQNSAASRIISLVEESEQNKGNSEKLISRFARIYTPVVIIIALLIAIIPSIITGDYHTWILRALTCLVASCPCSIVISIPLAYFAGIGRLSKSGVLVKGGKFVEVLAKTECIAFDKTGTITDSNLKIDKIESYNDYTKADILKLASSIEQYSEHPIAKTIIEAAKKQNIDLVEMTDYKEVAGFGVTGKYEGKSISCGTNNDDAIIVKLDEEIIGKITVTDNIREEVPTIINELKKYGVQKLIMLTGDNKSNAKRTAENIGIEYKASLLPEDKVSIISSLQNEYNNCCFIGDGINDAPVLAKSSCGIAMGLGSQAAIESSDAVLSSGNLSALPTAIRICKKIMNSVKGNLIFSLLFKLAIICCAAFGFAPMWLAVAADTGVCLLCVLNSIRLLKTK